MPPDCTDSRDERTEKGSTIANASLSVGVTFEPCRPGLPVRQGRVCIPDWHFYLRQTLGLKYLILRDEIVDEEQKSRQRVYLIGRERALTIERHGAIDVIPHLRRERRAKRQYSSPLPKLDVLASPALQDRCRASDASRTVACCALRAIDLRSFLGGSSPWRKFFSGWADGNVPCADFLGARRASHSIRRRLRAAGAVADVWRNSATGSPLSVPIGHAPVAGN